MVNTSSTAAVILAAGSSSRMGGGRHKLLLLLDERPVLAHVIEAALAALARPIVVVLGHQAKQVREQMAAYLERPGVIVVENRDYLQGMSTSMRAGLGVLIERNYVEGGQEEKREEDMEKHREEVETVELRDVTASYDVDSWEAYQEVVEAWQKRRGRHW